MPLSADQRQVLAALATAGRDGMAQALLSAQGFDASMIAGLVHRGLAILTTEKILAGGKLTALIMVTITEAGRRAFATENMSHRDRAAAGYAR